VTQGVWIAGAYQSDFARNLTREGRDFAALTEEVVAHTLAAARIGAEAVDVIHVGNAFGEVFAGQGHLGAMPATVNPALWGVPAVRHEAACASGSVATRAAIADLCAGFADVALVVGIELEKTVPGHIGAERMGVAAWAGHEEVETTNMWAWVFAQVADEYDRRYGLDDAYLHAIAVNNYANAKRNPNAQTRDWEPPTDDADNPFVEGRLRRIDCSQLTDGGAGLVLVTDRYLRDHPEEARAVHVPCVIFDGRTEDFAAEMFVIINSTPTRINKSHLVDLYERVTWADPDRKFAARIAEKLYAEPDSPLRYRINRLGGRSRQEKWILQAELFNELHRWVREEWQEIERSGVRADTYYRVIRDFFRAAERAWGNATYMVTRPVTLKAMVRVAADLAREDADPEDGRLERWRQRLAPWAELRREFRADGFYERFPAKGQVERVARIHRQLARAAGIEVTGRAAKQKVYA